MKSFNADSNMMDNIITNIKSRITCNSSMDGENVSQPMVSGSMGDPFFNNNGESSQFAGSSVHIPLHLAKMKEVNGEYVKRGDYQSYHRAIAKTKTDRMLTQYEKYNRIWSANLPRQTRARDKLEGKVNESQRAIDKPIQIKVDEDYNHAREAKNIIGSAFEGQDDETVRVDQWISKLRQGEVGLGPKKRTICCNKREEIGRDLKLTLNKRSIVTEIEPEEPKKTWSSGIPINPRARLTESLKKNMMKSKAQEG